MNKWIWVVVFLVGCGGCSSGGGADSGAGSGDGRGAAIPTVPAGDRPNVLVIMVDDQGDFDALRYMPKTRALLADQGMTFANSFVDYSLCCPSRASLLTGQSAHNHGIRTNKGADGGGWPGFQPLESNALPVWLKAAGYNTAWLGKYFNEYAETTHVPPGWHYWFAFASNNGKYFDYDMNLNGQIKHFGSAESDYSTDVIARRAVNQIEQLGAGDRPFFMAIAPKAPHITAPSNLAIPAPRHAFVQVNELAPRTPAYDEADVSDKPSWVQESPTLSQETKDYLDALWRSKQLSVMAVDDMNEAVITACRALPRPCLVIYTSDNGYLYGEHRLKGKQVGYDPSLRVPLLMSGPGIPVASTRTQLVNNLDVVATIVELTGASPRRVIDGRSLKPLFADANAAWRSSLLFHGRGGSSGPRFNGVRTETMKYMRYSDGFEELYDLVADPYEMENKATDVAHEPELTSHRTTLDALKQCAGDGCWVP